MHLRVDNCSWRQSITAILIEASIWWGDSHAPALSVLTFIRNSMTGISGTTTAPTREHDGYLPAIRSHHNIQTSTVVSIKPIRSVDVSTIIHLPESSRSSLHRFSQQVLSFVVLYSYLIQKTIELLYHPLRQLSVHLVTQRSPLTMRQLFHLDILLAVHQAKNSLVWVCYGLQHELPSMQLVVRWHIHSWSHITNGTVLFHAQLGLERWGIMPMRYH